MDESACVYLCIVQYLFQDSENVSSTSKVGDPGDPETKLGALISKEHMEKVLSYIALAKEEGLIHFLKKFRPHYSRCYVAPMIEEQWSGNEIETATKESIRE